MSCFAPIRGFWSEKPNANGKHVLVFNPKDAQASGHPFLQLRFRAVIVSVVASIVLVHGLCVACMSLNLTILIVSLR